MVIGNSGGGGGVSGGGGGCGGGGKRAVSSFPKKEIEVLIISSRYSFYL